MTPVAGQQRQKGTPDNESARQSAYEEIHAAILELYRMMGAPRSLPTTASPQYFPGYSVYTYPATSQAAPQYAAANPQQYVSGWQAPIASPPPIVGQYAPPSPSYLQPNGFQAWAAAY